MLTEGSKSPNFIAKDFKGNTYALEDFKGKKLVLYFYPKDNTPTCTLQACNTRDRIGELIKAGITILGISIDSAKKHENFEKKHQLNFPLLIDDEHKMVNDFGVWGVKKMMGKEFMGTKRTTFLINEKGIIEHIITKVDSKNPVAQILNTWEIKL